MKLGLRSKILIIALLVATGTVGAIAAVSSYFFTEQATRAYASRSVAIAKGLAIQLERILALGIDPADLQGFEKQCAEAVEQYQGLSYAMVVAPDGTVLFHSSPSRMGEPSPSELAHAPSPLSGAVEVDTAGRLHTVIEPVTTLNGEAAAFVAVGFPREIIAAKRDQLLLLTAGVGAGALALGLLLLYGALSYTVVRPISRFIASIERIGTSEEYATARVDAPANDDELGIMINGFNALLDRIAEREHDLVAAKEAAETANNAKSQFLAVMSHELRTPLSAVLGMTELLLRSPLDAKQQHYANSAKTSGQSLLSLINDILDFSRIEAGKLSIKDEAFDPRELAERAIVPFFQAVGAKGLQLSLEIDPALPARVWGDPDRIEQILINLLSNAVKFTERGSIEVSLAPARGQVRLAVTDTGVGISDEFINDMYEAFRQADGSRTRKYGGTGLGLAIVKQLADALGGQIEVRSQLGQGSTFEVYLPLPEIVHTQSASSPPPAAKDTAKPSVSPPARVEAAAQAKLPERDEKKQVLLAEDNEAHQELVRLYLADSRYEVMVVGTGALALDLFSLAPFDVVLMDWQLPDVDGLQATQKMREYEHTTGTARTPIIALTANAFPTDRVACLAAGMDDYLSKPFTPESLLATLDRWTTL